jgi:superoxide dismutase, Fe-Mn family
MATTLLKRAVQQRGLATRGIATVKLPDLAYDFGALEPVISGEIMTLHHQKHHQAYVTNYNAALEQYAEAEHKGDHAKMIALQPALKFNGGGHINHSIFWTNLAPPKQGGGGEPEGELLKAIETEFGSFEDFKKTFSAKTAAVQGSGWGWLGYSKEQKRVVMATLPNQDPLSTTGLIPLLGYVSRMAQLWYETATNELSCPVNTAWTCGSTRTTCSTRTCVRTT